MSKTVDPICQHCGQRKTAHVSVNFAYGSVKTVGVLLCPTALFREWKT